MPRVLMRDVEVYWNLHKRMWSVRRNGRVVRHARNLTLVRAWFKVSQAGRLRAVKERTRNVHAFACGDYLSRAEPDLVGRLRMTRVSYNPFRRPDVPAAFYLKPTDEPVDSALLLMLLDDGSVWACEPARAA